MTQTKAELLQTRHQGDIRLGDADSTHYVGFKAPATVGTSLVWTLPAVDGTANYLLKTDGSGNLGWVADSSTDSTKMPLAGGTFTGDVTFTGAAANIVFDKSDNALEFADNAKATFGVGSDLEIYHNGSDSIIHNATGNLTLRGSYVQLNNAANTEAMLSAAENGAVSLYYDNSKKLETTSGGITASGNIIASSTIKTSDSAEFIAGDGNDLRLWHNGTDSYIKNYTGDLHIQADGDDLIMRAADDISIYTQTSELAIKCIGDGAVELYHNNVKKCETHSDGLHIGDGGNLDMPHDSSKIVLGASDDLQIFHDGTHSRVSAFNTGNLLLKSQNDTKIEFGDEGGATELAVHAIRNGAVELYHDNTKKFETRADGAKLEGNLYMDDNKEVRLGDSGDFQLFHHNTSGEARVYNSNAAGISVISDLVTFKNNASNKTLLTATNGGSIDLYHNNVKKFETTAAGSKFTGGVSQVATAAGALDLDLNTSNYFTKTISGNSTFTFSNPAASGTVSIFMLELTHSSGTVTWPGTVKWNADTAPTLTTGKTHLFMFVTDDNGSRYRGSALVDYVN